MEMNFNGEGNSEARKFANFSICEYVAEVRRKDWKKCWPFKLFVDSKEPNCQPDVVSASLLPENSDAFDNTPENTKASNSSEEGISKVSEARSETNIVMVASREIGYGMVKTIDDGSLKVNFLQDGGGSMPKWKKCHQGATINVVGLWKMINKGI